MTTAATDETAALVGAVDREARRRLLAGDPAGPQGVDRVEVLTNRAGAPGHVPGAPARRTLLVHLLRGPVPAQWDAGRVRVVGGVRADAALNPVGVLWAYPATAVAGTAAEPAGSALPEVSEADRLLVRAAVAEDERDRVLVVRTTTHGDLSRYLLRITGPGGTGTAPELDPPLAQERFAFSVDCPSDADCAPPTQAPELDVGSPLLDYLSRDHEALRTLLLDRVAGLVPGWSDRSPADVVVMLLELFAAEGDRLASWQDAVATEAHLTTARLRTSVRRHARLLDHAVHDGCSARTWLALRTDTPFVLERGTAVADRLPDARAGLPSGDGTRTPEAVVDVGGTVVETTAALPVDPDRDAVPLHPWGDPDHVLPAGSTAAFLAVPPGADPALQAGDLLVLAELPPGGAGGDDLFPAARGGDPSRRYAVRLDRAPVERPDALSAARVLEVRWAPQDALTGPLTVSQRGPDGQPVPRAVALANVVPADQGATVAGELLDPPQAPEDRPWRPRLRRPQVACTVPVDTSGPAARLLRPDPRAARPQVVLDDGTRTWTARADLLDSGRLDAHVVVEAQDSGVARLRFGDGTAGRRPPAGAVLRATYRVGAGAAGDVAADRLTELLDRPDGRPAVPAGARVEVWNPLAATGGVDPEPVEAVRQLAPYAFRRQLRAVTSRDHADLAQEHDGVQRAVARRRWTGSWYAQEITVDAVAARAADPDVPAGVLAAAEARRMAGTDVEVVRPVPVPLHLVVEGCVAPGHLRADVEQALQDALSSRDLPGGRRGLFHADAFTFGQPLHLSDLVGAAMAVPGVDRVAVTRFSRAGAPAADTAAALARGRLTAGPREVLRCDSDADQPESGRVEVRLRGGA